MALLKLWQELEDYLLNTIFTEHLLKSGVKNQNIIFIDLTKISNRADNLKKTLEEKKAGGIVPIALRDELTEENNDEPI